jgi:hypothetical protein
MLSQMKATVRIPDKMLAEIRKIAERNKTTLNALVHEGLKYVVVRERAKKKTFKLRDLSYSPKHLVKKIQKPAKWEELRSLIYERSGTE